MNAREIELLAAGVFAAYRLEIPLDVVKIASEERIELAPGDYPASFHGRLEYHSSEGVFILFHPRVRPGLSEGRIRFSICHEFGHYFIEEHRELIISGRVHNSVECFKPVKLRIEREADQFAAALLIPQESIFRLGGAQTEVPLIALIEFADRAQVSIQASLFRYTQLADEACVAIVSKRGKILRTFSSKLAEEKGFGRLGIDSVPDDSAALKCLGRPPFSIVEGPSDTSRWFSERRYWGRLWEESTRVGSGDFAVTMLSWPEERN